MNRAFLIAALSAATLAIAQTDEAPAAEAPPPAEEPAAAEPEAAPEAAPAEMAAGEEAEVPAEQPKPRPKRRPKPAPKAEAPKPPAPAPEKPEVTEEQSESVEELVKQAERDAAKFDLIPDEQPATPEQLVEAVARDFFLKLASGDARGVIESCAFPFVIEGQSFNDPKILFEEWLKRVRSKRVDLLVLYGVEVLSPQEMEKKYGAPPARLGNFGWKGPKTYVAIANLSGRPAVAVLKQLYENDFRVIAYTD